MIMLDNEHNELGSGIEDNCDEDKVVIRDKWTEDGSRIKDRRYPIRLLIGF